MKPIHMAGPQVTQADVQIVLDALQNGWYEKPYHYVEAFQKEFAAYHGRKYGIMTPNCTTAIHLLLTAIGVNPGDEVVIPECTWIATAAPVSYLGATPVFCDIEKESWCMDPLSLEKAITPKTKVIIAVDLFGNMPQMERLTNIAKKHGVFLVEDSAEALGSKLDGVRAGKFGIGSVFSFHRTKTLTTGEGGMLLLDDDKLYERCMFLRDHGRKPGGAMYYNYEVTYKYMPFNVQAALGYAQFLRLDELIHKKREIFYRYRDNLKDVKDLQFNAEPANVFNSVWITGLVFGASHRLTKQGAIDELQKLGVPARPFFYPLSMLPAYPGFEQKYRDRNPCAYDISSRGINLPGALNLENDQIDFVCEGIRKIVAK
jgi:perosamine synthetase